jgi:putative DNA primase/helicase
MPRQDIEDKPRRRNVYLLSALTIARALGADLPVHPVRPRGKVPILKDWPNRASTDPERIKAWWRRWPRANVGIACGGKARLLVLDVDPSAGGVESVRALKREHGEFPRTLQASTARDGRHLYFFVPAGREMPGNSAGLLGLGIDTRGQGGQVVAPPSTVLQTLPDGRRHFGSYRWLNRDEGAWIQPAPDWLLDRLQEPASGRGTTPAQWLELATAGIDHGARNNAVTALAGLLFRRMPREAETAAALIACFNEVRCRPPLGAAELAGILNSIADRERRRWECE